MPLQQWYVWAGRGAQMGGYYNYSGGTWINNRARNNPVINSNQGKQFAFCQKVFIFFNSLFPPNLQGAMTTWDLLFSQCISELKYQENINYRSIWALQITPLRHSIKTLKTNLSKYERICAPLGMYLWGKNPSKLYYTVLEHCTAEGTSALREKLRSKQWLAG